MFLSGFFLFNVKNKKGYANEKYENYLLDIDIDENSMFPPQI